MPNMHKKMGAAPLHLACLALCSTAVRAADISLRNNNGQTFSDTSGTISDGYSTYASNLDLRATVRAQDCVLTWRSFDVEEEAACGYDYVEVLSGGSSLGKWCGSNLPPQVRTSGSSFTVMLHSDGAVQASGFELGYQCNSVSVTPPSGTPTPGSRLNTFYYGKHQTSADSKYWRREHWNPTLTEVSDVLIKSSWNDWTRTYDTRTTLAHETCHGIDNSLETRGEVPCRHPTRGFYLGGYRATCLSSPSQFNKDDVLAYIPSAMRWGRHRLYIEKINLGKTPLLLLEEWNCYIIGGQSALELYQNRLLLSQGRLRNLISGHGNEERTVDNGLGSLEFMGYSFGVALAAEARDPAYLRSAEGVQFKEFMAFNVKRTFDVYCGLKPFMGSVYTASRFHSNYEILRTGSGGRTFRDLGERWFGRGWWNAQLNCRGDSTTAPPTPRPPTPVPPTPTPPTPVPPTPVPPPPTPAPVEDVRLTLRNDNGVRRVATSGRISDGWGEYPSDTDAAVTVLGDNCVLTWTSFDVEDEPNCEFDYIEVLVGTSSIAKYCGSELPPSTRLQGSTEFTIKLHSDPAVQGSGFFVDFLCGTTVPPTPLPTPVPVVRTSLSLRDNDGAAVSASAGRIVDGYDAEYAPNKDHAVTVWGQDCVLTWDTFDVEDSDNCIYDYAQVFGSNGVSLGKFCGSTRPAPVTVRGTSFTVAFHSDEGVQAAGFGLSFTCSAAVAVPPPPPQTPTPPSSSGRCSRGTNIDIRYSIGTGASRMRDFQTGLEAAVTLLESILCRDSSSSYPPHHTVRIGAERLNDGSSSGVSGGVADTPNANRYSANERYSVTVASGVNNQQGLVWSVLMHEICHTLSVKHVGGGFMLSGQLQDYQFIDRPVADALRAVGVRFIDDVDARLQRGQTVQLDELLQRYTPYTYAGLRAMRT
eukprot:TRINITY_DN1467_c0_g1_i4.p1 TRINITY_DN1467_c0_g1~~TRINITY_DN1467_c0_g1_i4.p1  ORF type:complete len:922 (+),score=202.16 TRINITY_DN1467_c0_g1_i4:40-2805(+)